MIGEVFGEQVTGATVLLDKVAIALSDETGGK
jgi:hypothetical protein